MEGPLLYAPSKPGPESGSANPRRSAPMPAIGCGLLAALVTLLAGGAWAQDARPSGAQGEEGVFIDSFEGGEDPPPPDDSCPPGYTSPLSGGMVTWQSQTGQPFPDPPFWERTVGVPRAGYLAIQFNTANRVNEDGGMKTLANINTDGNRRGAISKCPGDFSQHLPDTSSRCTQLWTIGGTLNWSTEGAPATWECPLKANTTYYFNLTFTNGQDPSTDQCQTAGANPCQTILRLFH